MVWADGDRGSLASVLRDGGGQLIDARAYEPVASDRAYDRVGEDGRVRGSGHEALVVCERVERSERLDVRVDIHTTVPVKDLEPDDVDTPPVLIDLGCLIPQRLIVEWHQQASDVVLVPVPVFPVGHDPVPVVHVPLILFG